MYFFLSLSLPAIPNNRKRFRGKTLIYDGGIGVNFKLNVPLHHLNKQRREKSSQCNLSCLSHAAIRGQLVRHRRIRKTFRITRVSHVRRPQTIKGPLVKFLENPYH